MKLRPLSVNCRVIVRRDDDPERSAGGVIIPIILRNHARMGVVVEVNAGLERKPEVKRGDRVVFGQYAGTDIEHGGELLTVMPEDDIMAVLEV